MRQREVGSFDVKTDEGHVHLWTRRLWLILIVGNEGMRYILHPRSPDSIPSRTPYVDTLKGPLCVDP